MTVETRLEAFLGIADAANLVSEATAIATQYELDDDEVIFSIAKWLYHQQRAIFKSNTDSTVQVPSEEDLHKFVKSLLVTDDFDSDKSALFGYNSEKPSDTWY